MSKWPKLTETLSPVIDLKTCQNCCGKGDNDPDFLLARWREFDDRDKPTDAVVLLCRKCSDLIIEPHPRLYERLHNWAPLPGSMPTCETCQFRKGITCMSPQLKSNGGEGLPLRFPTPIVMFIDGKSKGRNFGYQHVEYNGPVTCQGRKV